MRLVQIVRCLRCRRQVAWVDAYGWCVGCKRTGLKANERIVFDYIRARGKVPETSVPAEMMEALVGEELVEVNDGWAREKRH